MRSGSALYSVSRLLFHATDRWLLEKEDGGLAIDRMPAGLSAAYSMLTGEAQEYHAQMLEYAEICRSAPDEDVVLPPLTAEPWVLTYLDITENPTDWKNTAMAEYYGNASVRLQSNP